MHNDTPVWFITGCSSGLGLELAKAVLARGWRAVLPARHPEQLVDIAADHDDRAFPVQLDVTDQTSIEAAANVIIAAVQADEPPLRLLLGAGAYKVALGRLDALRGNFEAWRETTLSADFPEIGAV